LPAINPDTRVATFDSAERFGTTALNSIQPAFVSIAAHFA